MKTTMYAYAYANNDIAIIQWKYSDKIEHCLGFCIERINAKTGKTDILPAWVGFEGEKNEDWHMENTELWPIQKFNWKDLTAPKGQQYKYRITPMMGKAGFNPAKNTLTRTSDNTLILETNTVSISMGDGPIKACFNRGILSTQALSHNLPGGKKGPSLTSLKDEIANENSQIRKDLTGDLKGTVASLIQRAIDDGGKCYCALYELTDTELINKLIEAGPDKVELILSNANTSKITKDEEGKKHTQVIIDGENKPHRRELKKAGLTVYDRYVPSGHIGHNKFVIYEAANGKKQAVLSGSTNWTPTGLCAQSNNAIVIEDEDIANTYYSYWERLRDDTKNNDSKQAAELRESDQKKYPKANSNLGVWFSPNTDKAGKPKSKGVVDLADDEKQPKDINELFTLMEGAQKSILFLAFQPGTPSILDKALSIQERNKSIFVRGAATDAKAVGSYNTALFHGDSMVPDFYDVVAASNVKDAFSYWEQELLSAGHAIIHDKIVVIDPFSENCVVATGSHNLGYKASYDNDENMLIIKGDRALAEAYAAHVMDVYDHYRWRYSLVSHGTDEAGRHNAFNGLIINDSWQDKYFENGERFDTTGHLKHRPTKDVTFFEPHHATKVDA